MNPQDWIARLDDARITAAIAEAEKATTGEIRVCISHRHRDDALAAARNRFLNLRMDRTRQRNAVLLYFVPLTRQFALWGDIAVHAQCGDAFWRDLVARMTPLLREERFTDAIVLAVRSVGELLARHFPPDNSNPNELSNRVIRD